MSIIMIRVGSEGLMFIQTLTDNEEENCRTSSGLFEVLSEKFNLSLIIQYCYFDITSLDLDSSV